MWTRAHIVGVRRLPALLLCLGLPLIAQQSSRPLTGGSPHQPRFQLKTSVDRVIVNVTVTDNRGNPIHGLTKAGFAVKEDGQPQRILYFREHNLSQGMNYVPPKVPALPADTFVNLPSSPERGPLYVLLYDLVNIPSKYQPVARAQLVKFLEAKPAGVRMAIIVSSDGLHLVQGFTANRQKLLAAVNPRSSHPHVPMIFLMGVNFGRGDPVATAGRLDEIAQYLAPMPGRKNLIWFSSKFPLSLINSPNTSMPLQALAKKTLNLLADNQIAVYLVDATGLPTYESYAPRPDYGKAPSKGHRDPAETSHGPSLLHLSYWTQDSIARLTGGEAIYSRNRLAGALAEMVKDGGSYYTLSYSPSNKNFKGHLRHIEVMLKKEHYHLSYRRAYYGTRESATPKPSEQGIKTVMEHGAPEYHQLIFGVHLQKEPSRHGAQRYTILYTVMTQQLRALGDVDPRLEIAATAYGVDGQPLQSAVDTATQPASSMKQKGGLQKACQMEIPFAVSQAARFLRFGVRDLRTGRVGALEIPLPLHSR